MTALRCGKARGAFTHGSDTTGPAHRLSFPASFNWPVWVDPAARGSFFARAGIECRGHAQRLARSSSGPAWRRAISISPSTLMDNVVAYREGQGEAPVTVKDAIAVMASDTSVLPALITPAGHQELLRRSPRPAHRHRRAPSPAMRCVLVAMLEGGGLGPDDYMLERAGGVQQRFRRAAAAATYAAALFNSPMEGLLERAGFNRLDTAASAVERYQGRYSRSLPRLGRGETAPLVTAFIPRLSRGGALALRPRQPRRGLRHLRRPHAGVGARCGDDGPRRAVPIRRPISG